MTADRGEFSLTSSNTISVSRDWFGVITTIAELTHYACGSSAVFF